MVGTLSGGIGSAVGGFIGAGVNLQLDQRRIRELE
jgi:uncharacterized membrane protein YfcA